MIYSPLKNRLICALASVSLFACSQDPDLHDPGESSAQIEYAVIDLTQSPSFDERHRVRTFSPSEIQQLNPHDHRFQLALFDGVVRDFHIDRINVLEQSGFSWFGSVDDNQSNYFSVTYRNGHAVGSALIGGIGYSIRSMANGSIQLVQLNTHDDVNCEAHHEHTSMKGGR